MIRSARMRWCLVVALWSAAGCGGCTNRTALPPQGSGSSPPATAVKPLLEGWERPAVALLFSGEQFGYLEPCGCSITQSGGLARRARLEAMLREKGWPLVALDGGNLVKDTRTQDQLKFEAILSGLKRMNYTAIAAGEAELRFQPDWLLGQFTESDGIPFGGLLLAANVLLFDDAALGVPKPYRIVSAGAIKVGVTAVLGAESAAEVAPAGVQSNITVKPAAAALQELLPQLQQEQPDLLVLLSHGKPDEAWALAEAFPEFSVVFTTGGAEEPSEQPRQVGDTLVVEVGHKGKHVGVLGYFPDATPKLRWELVNLDNRRFPNDPRMQAVMREYQQRLRDLNLAESDDLKIRHPTGDTFVGAEVCGECHKNAYNKWKGTKHAQAFHSLARGRKGEEANWVSRIYDPECLACHVTGWDPQQVRRFDSGYLNQQATAHLIGQQCENCHGPGQRHTDLERQLKERKGAPDDDVIAARAAAKRNSATAEKELCIKCHDAENSPEFLTKGFKFYWEQIKHPWKD